MKKLLSNTITLIALSLVLVIAIGFYVYMISRPISYGKEYSAETTYGGVSIDATMVFDEDGNLKIKDTNLNQEISYRYYYKDGYVFYLDSLTNEEKEIESINKNFDDAIKTPYYADKINSFELVSGADGAYETVYTCSFAITLTIIIISSGLLLLGLIVASLIFRKKLK